jgi:hypothetical protein
MTLAQNLGEVKIQHPVSLQGASLTGTRLFTAPSGHCPGAEKFIGTKSAQRGIIF